MSDAAGLERPVPVESPSPSIFDLLRRFADPRFHSGAVTRLSDLHLKVGCPPQYRLDNRLASLAAADPLTEADIKKLVFPLITPEQVKRLSSESLEDIDASFDWPEKKLAFRINVFRDRDGLACAIRVLPRSIPHIGEIGFPTDATWKEITALHQGLVIVSGVTGSGKSTTLASLVQHINETRNVRLMTLEDPVEYVLTSQRALISQREVGRHVASFSQGFRSVLREDPDVVLVGEMRDAETTALALSAAETGHLVLSTLHTKDSRGAITRILDMFPAERSKELATQLSFSLSYVLTQKLIPRAKDGGRRLAMEVLRNLPGIAHQIRSGNLQQLYSTMQTRNKEGLNTLEQHLVELVRKGEITAKVASQFANEPQSFAQLHSSDPKRTRHR